MTRRRAGWSGVALALAALAISGVAGAQEASKAQEAKARFIEGRGALERGEVKRAYLLFRASQVLNPVPATLLNLAICEEKLGKLGSAWSHFREAVAQVPAGDDRLPAVKERIEALKQRLPWLRIDLAPGAPEGTRVIVDERPLEAASLGVPQAVDPGPHEVVVTAPGRPERRYGIDTAERQSRTLTVEPGARPDGPVEPPAGDGLKKAGFAIGGVGLAALGVAGVTGVLAIMKKGELSKLCPEPASCRKEGLQIAQSGTVLGNASTATLAIGLAATAAGATIVGVRSRGGEAKVQASVLPGGFVLQGSF